MTLLSNGKKSIANLKDIAKFVDSNALIEEIERLRSIDKSWIPKTVEIPADMEKGSYEIASNGGTRGRLHYTEAMTWFRTKVDSLEKECAELYDSCQIVYGKALFVDKDGNIRDPQLAIKIASKKDGSVLYEEIDGAIVKVD